MRKANATLRTVLAALLLAGCTGPTPPAEDEPPAPLAPAPAEAAYPALAPRSAPEGPTLAATLAMDAVWLRPVQDLRVSLDAPQASRARWYVGVEGVHPEVRIVNGRPYVTSAPGKAAEHPASTGLVAPGETAALRLAEPGRHLFALAGAPEASLVVTVAADAADARATVFLVQDETGPHLLPERVALRPGGRLAFLNQATLPLDATRTAFQPWLAQGLAPVELTPVDEGLYTLHVEVEDDAGARGEAAARFLVDFDRPAARRDVGPLRGGFLGLPEGEEETVRVEAEYSVREGALYANLTARGPGEAALVVSLERDGATLARMRVTGRDHVLPLHELAPGVYVVRIRHEAGNLVDYGVEGRLHYRLPVPERLRAE